LKKAASTVPSAALGQYGLKVAGEKHLWDTKHFLSLTHDSLTQARLARKAAATAVLSDKKFGSNRASSSTGIIIIIANATMAQRAPNLLWLHSRMVAA
jgi:hypothetical protein